MKIRPITAVIALAVAAFWVGTGTAAAHFLTEDSVDCSGSPCEIRYEDYSIYDGAHDNAIAQWEALPGGVSIAVDSVFTNADLELRDYTSVDNRCGYWDGRTGADLLNMNKQYMEGYTIRDRQACVIHEWGHPHRLAHSYNDQVMDDCPVSNCGSTYIAPQNHDKSNYDGQW